MTTNNNFIFDTPNPNITISYNDTTNIISISIDNTNTLKLNVHYINYNNLLKLFNPTYYNILEIINEYKINLQEDTKYLIQEADNFKEILNKLFNQ